MKELFTYAELCTGIAISGFLGGIVDYINQIRSGTKKWSMWGFIVHVVSAIFFGIVCGGMAVGFIMLNGPPDTGVSFIWLIVSAAGGLGGFLGVRVADLITWKLLGADRRRK